MDRARRGVTLVAILGALASASCSKSPKEPEGRAAPAASATGSVTAAASASTSAGAASSAEAGAPAVAKGLLRKLVGPESCDEERAYVDCVVKACAGVYRECYGAKVDEGLLDGACKEHGECAVVCSLETDEISRAACDLDCEERHRKGACDACMTKVSACVKKAGCVAPAGCK